MWVACRIITEEYNEKTFYLISLISMFWEISITLLNIILVIFTSYISARCERDTRLSHSSISCYSTVYKLERMLDILALVGTLYCSYILIWFILACIADCDVITYLATLFGRSPGNLYANESVESHNRTEHRTVNVNSAGICWESCLGYRRIKWYRGSLG